ncbi:receptor-interacting serine/threonine-protein kinase 3-like isoform X2 [Perca fluviatilis]|uniref:receptor-interacting serine/threonine-protein kinase 3-like isoform X2 n=1 Tax=Perca fluviatilis TaxID=8168 RepID=UPI001964D81F|nr:receptor-interacting serine/threonine-protein kinase 3-like isoform X2 [Perca fluviatilis]
MEQFIENSSLEGLEVIGSGGFGQIYKARHRRWACDVAIKLLRHDDGNNKSLLREIKMMQEASSPHVIRVLGVFKGQPPNSGWATQLGVVMELMERGSLASLQEALDGPPPWPLVFRLVHQVALGINFLHSLPRPHGPVLHLDLKPQNVLLDDALNAKLTDFGLSRISYSVSQVSRKDDEDSGGTVNYMPPEAFGLTYKPKRASDIYSYGILIWSITTGEKPYEYANPEMVMIHVPDGKRPPIDDIKGDAAGLTELKELMKRCWDNKPEERPQALECTTKTEELYQKHKHAISDTVHEVLKKLDQKEEEESDVVDNMPTGPSPIQRVTILKKRTLLITCGKVPRQFRKKKRRHLKRSSWEL